MMKKSFFKTGSLRFVSFIYWIFLTYMIAAFIWWYVSLEKQNDEIAAIKFNAIQLNDASLEAKVNSINTLKARKQKQFLGEGLTFLILFLLGAVYVYRSLKKQLNYSNQQQNFMMAVTHELKTPIAVTQLNLETLQKRTLTEEQQKKLIDNALKETQRLDTLSNNILLASQLDMGSYQQSLQVVNFTSLVQEVAHSFLERFPARKLALEIASGVQIQGEPLLLQMLVNNLIENAHKYSGADTHITIQLEETPSRVTLKVKDLGIGISLQDKARVFEKFYRVGAETTRSTKGTGLGLYLCKKIAEYHTAQLNVTDNSPQGCIFSFILNK